MVCRCGCSHLTSPVPAVHSWALTGNHGPVHEEVFKPATVVHGDLPAALVGGAYVRTGPNPVHTDGLDASYHWFDGDGMLHLLHFGADSVNYTNKQVQGCHSNVIWDCAVSSRDCGCASHVLCCGSPVR